MITDSKNVFILREAKHLPVYYFPEDDVRTDFLVSSDKKTKCPVKGKASHWSIEVKGKKTDVRLDLLEASDTISECPYKGRAFYYSINVEGESAKDIIWYYTFPNPGVIKIKDRFCFFTEKIDEVYIDGEKIAKQKTPWS